MLLQPPDQRLCSAYPLHQPAQNFDLRRAEASQLCRRGELTGFGRLHGRFRRGQCPGPYCSGCSCG
jgi:hypothetical protein